MFRPNWQTLTVAESPRTARARRSQHRRHRRRTRRRSPLATIIDIAGDDLSARFGSVLANNDEEQIEDLLQQDGMLIGLSDAGAHVSQLCDACLPTDLLGSWVRDREVLTLERAVAQADR